MKKRGFDPAFLYPENKDLSAPSAQSEKSADKSGERRAKTPNAVRT